MKYRELLEKYKEDLISEEEKQIVEQDIEKYEAIEEYLSERIDMDLFNLTTSSESEQHNEETIKIKKSVNSRLRKVVFTSVSIVIALVIGVFFVISPLIGSYYYNPAKITVGEGKSDINFDLYAITELNLPGYSLSSDVHVEKLGFGEYDIGFSRRNLFAQESNHVTTKIKRSIKITNHTEFIEDNNFYFINIRVPIAEPEHIDEQKQRVMNHIMKLNPVSYVSASLTFEKDLTMEELHRLELKYPDIKFVWAGIRTAPISEDLQNIIGIHLIKSNYLIIDQASVEKKYPAFHILEWLVNPTGYKSSEMSLEAKAYELHYKSLLKYMIDRNEATKVLESDFSNRKLEYYKSALDYAEEYGVKTFGVLIYANAEDIIELVENEPIKLVEINQVLASKGYIR